MKKEDYKPIPTFPHYYITRDGVIISFRKQKPKLMTNFVDGNGYIVTNLYNEGIKNGYKKALVSVANMVLLTWGPEKPGDGYKVKFLDGNKQNIHISNLEWISRSEIMKGILKRIRPTMKNKKKNRYIIVADGFTETNKTLGISVHTYLNKNRRTKQGFLIFDENGYEKWKISQKEK
jgi:hypothetical protein